MVRQSDASSLNDGKKRKLETLQETSDKENEEDMHSNKKMKPTPASTSKLPRRTPGGRSSAISKSRLNFLATPKRSRA
jgi:uncharacterized protein with von Willebrand factor type A (vWA) domain